MASWENWQKPVQGENSYQSQLFQTSGEPRKGDFSHCLFLSKFTLTDSVWGCPQFPTCLSPFCVLRAWPGFLPAWGTQVLGLINMQAAQRQVWSRQVMDGQSVGCTPFARSVLPTVASSGGLV